MGYSVKKLQSLSWQDIRGMSKKELKEAVNYGYGKASARLKTLKQSTTINKKEQQERKVAALPESPALKELKKSKGGAKFHKAGSRNVNQLRSELSHQVGFLSAKTSTVSGWKSVIKDTAKMFGISTRAYKKRASDLWRLFDKYLEEHPAWGSEQIMEAIGELVVDKDWDTMTQEERRKALDKKIKKMKIEEAKAEEEADEIAKLFD